MKANIKASMVKKISENIAISDLQQQENEFANKHGINPREVVYAPFDPDVIREIILDHATNIFYPINADEFSTREQFRAAYYKDKAVDIENELLMSMQSAGGCFYKSRDNQIYIFSNQNLNPFALKYILKHETFHAGVYDIIHGKASKLKVYKNKKHNPTFYKNMINECKYITLINNRNFLTLKEIGNPSRIFHNYSFEEDFVIFNSVCSMLDEEVNKPKVNMDNINYLLKIYLHDTGILSRTQIDNKPIQIYGKTVPLKSYVETYLNILTSPTISYDEIDSPYISTIIKTNTNNIILEEIDSQIPELFDELLTAALKNQSEIYLKRLIDIYKINAKTKRNKHLSPQKNLLSSI